MGTASVHRSVGRRFYQVLFIVALMLGVSSSSWARVNSIEMLAPGVGWTTTTDTNGGVDRLFWTRDGGAHWRNITPNPFTNSEYRRLSDFSSGDFQSERITSIFFSTLTEDGYCSVAVRVARPRPRTTGCLDTIWP